MAARDSIGTAQFLPTVDGVEFRLIPGFIGYAAGSDGSVWSCRLFGEWRRLKPSPRKEDGRARYSLKSDSGKLTRFYGSHFVLFAFVGQRPEGMVACHKDGNCLNDSPSNLRWDTDLENHQDMLRHGTQVGGEKHPKTKLTDLQIMEVLELRRGGMKLKSIANSYGVTETRVHQICKKGSR